jgi:hypothetical protein
MQNTTKPPVTPEHDALIRTAVASWAPDVTASLVRTTNVYRNRYRVDVFTKQYIDNGFVPRQFIAASFFVAIVDDVVVDLTVEPKES